MNILEKLNTSELFTGAINTYKDFLTKDVKELNNSISDFEYFTYNHPESGNFHPRKDYQIVLLYSGGIDSYIAYYYAKSKYDSVKLVFVNYGQSYAKEEYEFIKTQNLDVTYIDITPYTNIDIPTNTYGEIFPGRNWILSVIASEFIERRGEIWMVAIGGEVKDLWGDKSKYFFDKGSELLSEKTGKSITITSPFKEKTKGMIIKWYLKNGYNKENLLSTVSCHDINEEGPCGKCMGCAHRTVGFVYNNIIESNFRNSIYDTIDNLYSKELNSEFSEFSEQRKLEIKITLDKLKDIEQESFYEYRI